MFCPHKEFTTLHFFEKYIFLCNTVMYNPLSTGSNSSSWAQVQITLTIGNDKGLMLNVLLWYEQLNDTGVITMCNLDQYSS
jgi:hypothetical protein